MSLTLLLDLDDTLLSNDMNVFIPAYLQALGKYMAEHHDSADFVENLLAATRQMIANNDPRHTLKQAFEAAFYPSLGIEPSLVKPAIDDFYENIFPSLEKFTEKRPDTVKLIDQAAGRGYRIVIATNPLFPATAINQRLVWAGVAPDQYNFQLVSSYETFHFAKPNPAYYAEILARLGWPEQPVVMVGNDPVADIQAAGQMGLPTFWINQTQQNAGDMPGAQGGSLAEVLNWIDSIPDEQLLPDYSSPLANLAILRTTPAVITHFLQTVDPALWKHRPGDTEWSLTEIICHLRDVDAEVNLTRLHRILAESNAFIPGAVTDPWAEERQYNQQDCLLALETFVTTRISLLQLLEELNIEQWEKSFRHAIFGPTPLSEMVKINAAHDRAHVQQIVQTIDSLYSYAYSNQPAN